MILNANKSIFLKHCFINKINSEILKIKLKYNGVSEERYVYFF